jgi:hypothetical protein
MTPVTVRLVPVLVLAALVVAGCSRVTNTVRELAGIDTIGDPSVNLKSAETRWLLIKNPRFGDVPSEPEYIWVEEDKVPLTMKTLVLGKGSIIAPPEIVARYGPPPGGGKISARQGGPYQVADAAVRPTGSAVSAPPKANAAPAAAAPGVPPYTGPTTLTPHGYVVFIDTTRIVIDLTARDGVRPGALVSLRRDRVPIVHPITGEILGELDEEIGTARVTEIRDKFSVAEIQTVLNGSQIQVKDRAVLK